MVCVPVKIIIRHLPVVFARHGGGVSVLLRLKLEVKGWDPLEEVKRAAAVRWCAAVNVDEKTKACNLVTAEESRNPRGIGKVK